MSERRPTPGGAPEQSVRPIDALRSQIKDMQKNLDAIPGADKTAANPYVGQINILKELVARLEKEEQQKSK